MCFVGRKSEFPKEKILLPGNKKSGLTPIYDEDTIKSMLKESQRLFRQRKYNEAKKICQEILKVDPENASAFNNLGSIYLVKKRMARAERYFAKALDLDPDLKEAEENLKSAIRLRRKKSQAEITREVEALEADCKILLQKKRIPDAIKKFIYIAELDPTNARALNNLGILHFQLGELEKGEEFFIKALEVYFHHGLAFDDQYATIKENLSKLREKAGSKVSEYLRRHLLDELSRDLAPDEKVLQSLVGTVKIPLEDGDIDSSAVMVASSMRGIIYSKDSLVYGGEKRFFDIPYLAIKKMKVIPGILKSTLIVETESDEYQIISPDRDSLRQMEKTVREIRHKLNPSLPARTPADIQLNVAFNLMDSLVSLGVFTEEEIESKKEEFKRKIRKR